MELDEYNASLWKLGLRGPMGERRLSDGTFIHFYKLLADGSQKELVPGSTQTPEQRAETIKMLSEHLSKIESRRNTKRSNN